MFFRADTRLVLTLAAAGQMTADNMFVEPLCSESLFLSSLTELHRTVQGYLSLLQAATRRLSLLQLLLVKPRLPQSQARSLLWTSLKMLRPPPPSRWSLLGTSKVLSLTASRLRSTMTSSQGSLAPSLSMLNCSAASRSSQEESLTFS